MTARFTSAILLVPAVLALSGCGSSSAKQAEKSGEAAPAVTDVRTVVVEMREVPVTIDVTGTFSADESSDIAPEIDGQVASTPVDVGAFVRRGTVLVRLNPEDVQLRLRQARAAEEQAQAALRAAEARVGMRRGGAFDEKQVPEAMAARAAWESARAQAELARADANRYAQLLKTGDIAQTVYDQANTRHKTMEAQAAAARQQYEAALNAARQSAQGIEGAQAALNAARAQAAIAQKAVQDTAITAPFDAYVSERFVSPGEYVTRNSKIMTLVKIRPIKALLQVPESEAARARTGLRVLATVQAYAQRQFEGKITAINPSVNPNSRAFTAEATFPNAEAELRPGMFATASIVLGEGAQVAFAPRNAVQPDPNTDSFRVWVIENGRARLRIVNLGKQEGDTVQIASGLKQGDRLAVTNIAQLYDGAPVRVQ